MLSEKIQQEIYCLFATCSKAMEKCEHGEYLVTIEELTLEEAEKQFPDIKFCESWEAKKYE